MPHSGNFHAFLGNPTLGTLSQSFTTVIGQLYQISFFLQTPNTANNMFSSSFDGVTGVSLIDSGSATYQQFTYNVTATTASAPLVFSFFHVGNSWRLDDITITEIGAPTGVPELHGGGATAPLLAVMMGLLSVSARRRQRAARQA